ncbi:unnamed protein product [Agarophyton chilense]
MVVGKHIRAPRRGAFILCPLRIHRAYNPLPGGKRSKRPFLGFQIPYSKRTWRPITVPVCCETPRFEDDDSKQVEEHNGTIWDFEFDEDELVDIEPDPSFPKLNVVALVGRLGADPVFKITSSGAELCTFSMAVTHDYDPNDSDEDRTSWFDIEAWGGLAKKASRAKKGIRVGVSGSLAVNFWTGRDGLSREDPFIRASTFEILQSRSEHIPSSRSDGNNDNREPSDATPTTDPYFNISGNLRDLPF